MPTSGSILGNPVLRKEDLGILEGTTQYYDDLDVAGLLHTAFVRSTVAHANIASIDTSDAKGMPGFFAVYTAADLELPSVHGFITLVLEGQIGETDGSRALKARGLAALAAMVETVVRTGGGR